MCKGPALSGLQGTTLLYQYTRHANYVCNRQIHVREIGQVKSALKRRYRLESMTMKSTLLSFYYVRNFGSELDVIRKTYLYHRSSLRYCQVCGQVACGLL